MESSQTSTKSPWEWLCSTEAANFAMVLLAIFAVVAFFYGPYLIRRWRAEKSAEKMSDIAEYGLNNLHVFLDEIKNWIIFGESFVYSKNSQANIQKKEMLPEKEKKEFIESLNNDPLEVNNYCKSGIKIVKILREIIYRVKRLSNPQIDETLQSLEKYTSQLPTQLFNAHSSTSPLESKEKSIEYLRSAPSKIEKDCSLIHDMLIDYLMFRKRKKSKS